MVCSERSTGGVNFVLAEAPEVFKEITGSAVTSFATDYGAVKYYVSGTESGGYS